MGEKGFTKCTECSARKVKMGETGFIIVIIIVIIVTKCTEWSFGRRAKNFDFRTFV